MTNPSLHCGISHFPRLDGSGRFPSYDDRFEHTEMLSVYSPTHSFRTLFMPDALALLAAPFGESFSEALDRMGILTSLLEFHAKIVLDKWGARFGLKAPPGLLTIFVDLEEKLIGREPYVPPVDPSEPDYSQATMRMMVLFQNRIEHVARARGWDVRALAYRPLRPTPLVLARPGPLLSPPPQHFVDRWGGAAIAPLLKAQRDLWVHCYVPGDTVERGASIRGWVWQQLRWAYNETRAAKATPERLWLATGYDTIRSDTNRETYLGMRDGLAEFFPDTEAHVVEFGDWGLLNGILNTPVDRVNEPGEPLALTIPTEQVCEALVTAWNRDVVGPFREVFSPGQATA